MSLKATTSCILIWSLLIRTSAALLFEWLTVKLFSKQNLSAKINSVLVRIFNKAMFINKFFLQQNRISQHEPPWATVGHHRPGGSWFMSFLTERRASQAAHNRSIRCSVVSTSLALFKIVLITPLSYTAAQAFIGPASANGQFYGYSFTRAAKNTTSFMARVHIWTWCGLRNNARF